MVGKKTFGDLRPSTKSKKEWELLARMRKIEKEMLRNASEIKSVIAELEVGDTYGKKD